MLKNDLELKKFAQEMRENYTNLIKIAGDPDQVFSIEDITIPIDNSSGFIQARVYKPIEKPVSAKFPLVLFAHGGCLVSGDLDTHDILIRALAIRLNAIVLSFAYRLAPENNALEQMEDSSAAFNWLYDHANELQGNPNKIIGIGDSAGGQIIANLAHLYKNDPNKKLVAQWLMYPVLSLNLETESYKRLGNTYFPSSEVMHMSSLCFMPKGISNKDERIFPLYANHENTAPTLISVGELDPLSSDSLEYAAALSASNVQNELKLYPQSEHGFIQYFKNKTAHPLGEKAFEDGIEKLIKWLEN